MPLRPHHLSRALRLPAHPARPECRGTLPIVYTRLEHRHHPQRSSFHTSSPYRADSLPNHYEVLELSQTATLKDTKRQFFALSKKHHPDKNRDDPNASTKFVAISEAYHLLSVPEKREKYDAQLHESQNTGWGRSRYPSGSFSSASYAGGRPATGLNKKRTTFRGPPPSFYKSGGYGNHGAKRSEHAYQNAHARSKTSEEAAAGPQESYGDFGSGFGPGQSGRENDVPHFDDRKHKETQEHVHEHIQATRRRYRAGEVSEGLARGGMLINFVLVSGVITIIGLTAKIFGDWAERKSERKRNKGA